MIFSFVTALYPIREGYLVDLASRFQNLLELLPQVPIFVWTDREWPTIIDSRIHWIQFPLITFRSYKTCMKPDLALPTSRDINKDTQGFMALMATKIEMLWRALPFSENPNSTTFIWIDAGISKIFQNREHVRSELAKLTKASTPEKILMPGCWNRGRPVSRNAVHWRFCGGYFLVPSSHLSRLQDLSEKWILKLVEEENRIMWEVNIWVEMENENSELFQWYKADHNDTIVGAPVKIE
jgi:hypothetical protein